MYVIKSETCASSHYNKNQCFFHLAQSGEDFFSAIIELSEQNVKFALQSAKD